MKMQLEKGLAHAQRIAFRYLQEVTNAGHDEEPKIPIGYTGLDIKLSIRPYSSYELARTQIFSFPIFAYSIIHADESEKRVLFQSFYIDEPTIDVKGGKLIRKPTRHEIYVAVLKKMASELLVKSQPMMKEIRLEC